MSHATKKASIVACYNHTEGVRQSVRNLKKHGIDVKKLSIAGKGCPPGDSLFIISGLGAIAVSGPLVGAIVRGFEGGIYFKGLHALREGLCSIGIPKDSLLRYESALKNGMCLAFARGRVDEIAAVKSVFASSQAIEIAVHNGDNKWI